MEILIFENEYADLEPVFKAINLLEFDGELNITQYNTSQDLESIEQINDYDVIIVDIDLSLKSHKDGYGILHDISNFDSTLLNKVVVLTGSTKVEEKLSELGYTNVRLALKPADMDEITEVLKSF